MKRILTFLILGLALPGVGIAQDTAPVEIPAAQEAMPETAASQLATSEAALVVEEGQPAEGDLAVTGAGDEIMPASMPSMFYTYWEHQALQDAKRTRGSVRPPTKAELEAGAEQGMKPPPEEREITLGGIVYASGQEWTIWLNGQRVTPKAVPSEALDLRVFKEYIEIKWFDSYTNQIFPLRLRPHQRFNMDSRIFLPG